MKNTQKDFFDKLLLRQDDKNEKAVLLYKDLVLHRYKEVISNAYPLLSQLLSKEKLEEAIKSFVAKGGSSEFIWKMPKEFMKFVLKNEKYSTMLPFIKDLMWFEWIEIELFMKEYENKQDEKFQWKNDYKLNKHVKIKKLDYKVHVQEFENKQKCILIAFYSVLHKRVLFKEISKFMFEFLKLMDKFSLDESLEKICDKYEIDRKKTKKMLKVALVELDSLGALTKKD